MTEVWLHSNRRVLLLAMFPVFVLAGIGAGLYWGEALWIPSWVGALCLGVAAMLLIGLLRQLFQPRIAYRDGCVLFYLKAGGPIVTPLFVVEGFFQGQSDAHLPETTDGKAKVANLIARLAQRETDWQERDVKAALGIWEKGYVTIYGTWCEQITPQVIGKLNKRLGEATRAHQVELAETVAAEGSDASEGATEA